MLPYTIESLKFINPNHFFSSQAQTDVDKINKICQFIEAVRPEGQKPGPQDGDRIVCMHPEKGKISPYGHLEKVAITGLSVCVHTMPDVIAGTFTENGEEQLYTHAGGGDWRGFTEEEFFARARYIGPVLTIFCTRSRNDDWLKFSARVNLWEVTDSRFH